MATIKGKRFQITDGASTPTNLFPYTVSEAVYGLSNTISNAISTALSALSLSTYAGTSQIGSATQPVYYNGSALVATNLSTTYAPYNANGYLPLSAGASHPLTGNLVIQSGGDAKIILDNTDTETNYQYISFRQSGTEYGALGITSVGSTDLSYRIGGNSHTILHAGNYSSYALPLTAGSSYPLTGVLTIKPSNTSGVQDGLVLTDLGGGANEGLQIRFISAAYTTGHTFRVAPDTGVGYIDSNTIWHSGNSNKSDVAWTASGFFTPNHGTHLTVGPDTWTYRTVLSSSWTRATGDYLDIGVPSSGAGNPSVIRLLGNGNVGIGTTSPGAKLSVAGDFILTNTTNSWPFKVNTDYSNIKTTIYAGFPNYGMYIGSSVSTGTTYLLNVCAGESDHGSGGTSRFYVRADGNVGIGTDSPAYKLDVNGSIGCSTLTASGLVTATGYNGAYLISSNVMYIGTASGALGNSYTGGCFYAYGNNPLYFYTNNNNRMIITGGGNVGIGTASPSQKLHVEGSIYAAGGYRTNSALLGLFKGSGITSTLTENDGALYYYEHTLAVWASLFKVNGPIESTGDQVVSSDATLKTNLADITYSVADIAKAPAVTFDWKDGRGRSAGSIAQYWKNVLPELVHGEEGNMSLAYGQLALVNTIIEAREIETLKARVAELEAEVKRLRMN